MDAPSPPTRTSSAAASVLLMAGAVLGLLGVATGAFGAHGLRGRVDAGDLEIWRTGAQYQQLHAVMVVVVGVLSQRRDGWTLRVSGGLYIAGIVVFAGTLYAIVLGAPRWLGAVTPLGGLCLMGGWLALLLHAWAQRKR